MRKLRDLILILTLLFILYLNVTYTLGKSFSATFYFVSLNFAIAILILIEVLYSFSISEVIQTLRRENDRIRFALSDLQLESLLLNTLTNIIETFGEEITLDEVLDRISDSLKEIFKKETVIIHLFGEKFKRCVKGKDFNIPEEVFEDSVIKGKPVLVNNTSSFPQYKSLYQQGITSFLISTFHQKRRVSGIIGIFSFEGRKFSLKDLDLLRMVSAPTSLLIENVELFEKTKILSITDSLTQLYNRRHFEDVLERLFMNAKNSHSPLSLCICDVDYFKHYNDVNGHPAGDLVLKKLAEILKKGVKGSDVVARYGGEEFVIIFPNTTKENAKKVCETLNKKIKEYKFPNEKNQPNGDLTVSFGIASFPQDAATPQELIEKADLALYKAKSTGRDKVVTA